MYKKAFVLSNFCSKRFLSLRRHVEFDWVKQEKNLMAPYQHVRKVPSKYYRLVVPSFNPWLQVEEKKRKAIQEAAQTMEAWTVLLDDIQDGSGHRYGVPSAHQVFGVGLTINAANMTLLSGYKQMTELGHASAPRLLINVIEDFCYGQGIDIYWTENFICPTEEAHIEMAKRKTGTWFGWAVELMQLFSNNKTDYSELAIRIGAYYHVVDDYINLFKPHKLDKLAHIKQENHCAPSDITECKITLAVVHAMQFPDVASEVAHIFKQRTTDPKLHSRAISLLRKHGSDEYMRDALNTIENEIRTEIKQLGGNPVLSAFVDDLSSY